MTESTSKECDDNHHIIAKNAPTLTWLSEPNQQYYFFNESWLHFTGRTLDQEIGAGWQEGIHPHDFERYNALYAKNFETRTPFYHEYRLKNRDGSYRWISNKAVPRYDNDGEFAGYIGVCLDIDEYKASELNRQAADLQQTAALEASRTLLSSVLNSTYYGIASYEPIRDDKQNITDFRIVYSNPEVPANFGLSVADVVGKTCREVYPGMFDNGVFEKLADCIKTGKPTTYEIDVQQNGKTLWFSAAIERINDSVTVTSKNTTEEKEAALHLEKMNELLNNKNKELASFTYIASHDLQEPLRKIQMFASRILENDMQHFSEKSMSHFNSISATANRMQHLIDALLSYSKMDSDNEKPEKTNLNKLVKEVLALLDTSLNGIEAIIEAEDLPTVRVIQIQFQQLFLNIIGNAIKYSKPGERPFVKIAAEKEVVDQQEYWKISIADRGIGFDPQYKEKIFEVFQRLHGKKEYVGTGVGLAICQKIIKNHNGFITADGTPDVGATFTIYLPIKS